MIVRVLDLELHDPQMIDFSAISQWIFRMISSWIRGSLSSV